MSALDLKSVMDAKDHQIVRGLIELHAPRDRDLRNGKLCILDTTWGRGRVWNGMHADVLRFDVRVVAGEVRPHCLADYNAMPVRAGAVDVLVWDPPHLPSDLGVSEHRANEHLRHKYGIGMTDTRGEDSIACLFPAFLAEAKRVLSRRGILLAKLQDMVHWRSRQWTQCEFVNACWAAGLQPCDGIIKRRGPGPLQPRGEPLHSRMVHSTWTLVRRPGRCHRRTW